MWNEVLNLAAGTVGIATSVGLLTWLAHYAFHTPDNKELNYNKEESEHND